MAEQQELTQPVELVFAAPINGAAYQFTVLAGDPMVCRAAFRVQKAGKTDAYCVTVTDEGVSCTCKDFIFRRRPKNSACKHIRRLESIRRALAAMPS